MHCFYLLDVTWWVVSINYGCSHWVRRKWSLFPALLLLLFRPIVEFPVIVILVVVTPLFISAAATAEES